MFLRCVWTAVYCLGKPLSGGGLWHAGVGQLSLRSHVLLHPRRGPRCAGNASHSVMSQDGEVWRALTNTSDAGDVTQGGTPKWYTSAARRDSGHFADRGEAGAAWRRGFGSCANDCAGPGQKSRGAGGGGHPPPVRRRGVCWSQGTSTRQHNKILVSGTIGAFRLCSDNSQFPTYREHTVSS